MLHLRISQSIAADIPPNSHSIHIRYKSAEYVGINNRFQCTLDARANFGSPISLYLQLKMGLEEQTSNLLAAGSIPAEGTVVFVR